MAAQIDYSVYFDTVQELYIGYYQRPADPAGLLFWSGGLAQIDTNGDGIIQSNENISSITKQFATSAESVAIYGNITSANIAGVVTQIYQNLFNRPPDAAGLAFYVNGFNAGLVAPGDVVWQVMNGAQGSDAVCLANKVTAAETFTQIIDPNLDGIPPFQATYGGLADASAAAGWLKGVGSDPTTIPSVSQTTTWITDNIADPGDPIYISRQFTLTEGTDFVDLSATGGVSTVNGVQTAPGVEGTYTNGDKILGNGSTILDLVLDSGSGNGGAFAQVSNVAQINLIGADSSTLQAVQFTNVTEVNLTDGVNGVDIFVDGLDLGTQISVSDVRGSISASFDDTGPARVYGWLENSGGNEDASTLLIDPDLNVTMNLADSASGSVDAWDGPVNVGTVDVTGGDNTWSGIFLDADGSSADDTVVAGDVTVSIGNSSTSYFYASANDNITTANISVDAGDSAMVEVGLGAGVHFSTYSYSSPTVGDITAGNVTITAGVDSTENVIVGAFANGYSPDATVGDITVGDVNMVAGDSSSQDVFVGAAASANYYTYYYNRDAYATVGDITVGDVNMVAGDNSSQDVYVGASASANYYTYYYNGDAYATAGDIGMGDVTMTAGDDSDLNLYVGAAADAYYTADANVGDITVGNITMTAGDGSSTVDLYVGARASASYSTADAWVGNISMGNIGITAGNDSTVNVGIGASAYGYSSGEEYVTIGDVTVGNIGIFAGDDSNAGLFIGPSTDGYVTVGDVSVGDVSLEVGNVTSIDSSASASVTIRSWAYTVDGKGVAGDLTVGDVSVTVGDGFVESTQTTEAVGYVGLTLSGESGAGAMNVGDVSLSGGDFASLTLYADHYASTGDVGAFSMGNVSIEAGESAYVAVTIDSSVSYTGNIGTFSLGDVDVLMQQDSYVDIDINNTVGYTFTGSGNIGVMTVGDISIVSGDNSTADINIDSEANSGSNASMTVGNISVALSATTTVDLIGDSHISVSMEHYAWGGFDSLGAMAVGDIDLSVGKAGSIYLGIYNSASAGTVDDMTVGNISVAAGNASVVTVESYYYNTGYVGNLTVGDISLDVGASSSVNGFEIDVTSTGGSIGGATVGDVSITLGKDTVLSSTEDNVGLLVTAEDNVGLVTVGDVTIDLAAGASIEDMTFGVFAGNRAKGLTAGDIDITAVDGKVAAAGGGYGAADVGKHYDGATVNLGYTLSGAANQTLTVGAITVHLDTLSNVNISISNTAGGVGNVVIGDLTVSGAVGAVTYTGTAPDASGSFSINVTDSGTTTIGDVDFSGYIGPIDLNVAAWADAGAAHITGNGAVNTITGNSGANIIDGRGGADILYGGGGNDTLIGGTGADQLWGEAGSDTFKFADGDTGLTGATIDIVEDWDTGGTQDSLSFSLVAGTINNFVDAPVNGDSAATDLASFIANGNDALNSTVKYYTETFGGITYVAVNYGSGDVDGIVEMAGGGTVTYGDIKA
jgi:hypothetical protein